MAATGKGQATNLNQSNSQALIALLNSIAPDAIPKDGRNLKEEELERLSERITELVGKDAVEQFSLEQNERGELVNEEGLPIIDVNEPFEEAEARKTGTAQIADQVKLISLTNLAEPVRERLRQQRDRVLDMLEEEERLGELRNQEMEIEARKELIRRKKEAEQAKERAKDMHKKMGRALLRTLSASEDVSKDDSAADPDDDGPKNSVSSKGKGKKTVSFADQPVESLQDVQDSTDASHDEWGDVSLARLRSAHRPTAFAHLQTNNQPMKMHVIERKPIGPQLQTWADSDDESIPEADDDDDSEFNDADKSQNSGSDSDVRGHEGLEGEGDFDFDYAQHQREIAFEYYAKRNTIGQAAGEAMMSQNDIEARVIPPDLGVVDPKSKPSISQFKASKLVSAYNASVTSPSTSLEGSILPASRAKALQRAIRTGKLDSRNELVGGENDSESEAENDAMQEILDLFRKGDVYNVGPDDIKVVPPSSSTGRTSTAAAVNMATLAPLDKPKVSKFKLDRSRAGPSSSRTTEAQSRNTFQPPAPLAKLPAMPTVIERQLPSISSPSPSPPFGSQLIPIESPSIPGPKVPPPIKSTVSPSQSQSTPVQQPIAIESSSYHPPGLPDIDTLPSSPLSMIVDSPSFPRPRTIPPARFTRTLEASASNSPSQLAPTLSSRRSTHSSTVMSSVVHERSSQSRSSGNHPPDESTMQQHKPKVSRFMAERID
ncbi:hypothetical protein AMATHDRAFT_44674 [Amanita thiersii Skay4041]|uniref:DUF3835 domain-containing protein n=1 Tax=Amanita thiersii Skay4041 TaxID=703135 RepID=A0A2A9NT10_9AGAR|nr:hypothetical protein AMATHDRAFT_44674 [Amanita thiersii Skay4041]